MYASHQNLKTPKIVVFRRFQQDFNEFTSLDHFFQEHITFFDCFTMAQMKDAAMRVFCREKTIALAEIFALELKFIVDTLAKWFNVTIKPKLLQLDNFQNKHL